LIDEVAYDTAFAQQKFASLLREIKKAQKQGGDVMVILAAQVACDTFDQKLLDYFSHTIEFKNPDDAMRLALLQFYAKKFPSSQQTTEQLNYFNRISEGLNKREIKNAFKNAARLSAVESAESISYECLKKQFEEVLTKKWGKQKMLDILEGTSLA
jgi:AAA+ superfamily predicted ATPase